MQYIDGATVSVACMKTSGSRRDVGGLLLVRISWTVEQVVTANVGIHSTLELPRFVQECESRRLRLKDLCRIGGNEAVVIIAVQREALSQLSKLCQADSLFGSSL